MKKIIVIAFSATLALSGPAMARGSSHSSGGSHGHSSGRSITGFRTSGCKSSSCYSKHPSGSYTHPITRRKHG